MSNLLEQLGLDPKDVEWYHLAACNTIMKSMLDSGMDDIAKNDPFFDGYESDNVIAEQADSICLSCPVIAKCFKEGVKNKDQGVWGGVYLDNVGRPSKDLNAHKTSETWKELRKIHGKITLH